VVTPIIDGFAMPDGAEEQLLARILPLNGEMIDPSEIANAIAFLSANTMRHATGTILVVDGGTVA
jgi:NAD(P)-dependent dehydrogenase (short-subunit alcohol dehydrogenase family)